MSVVRGPNLPDKSSPSSASHPVVAESISMACPELDTSWVLKKVLQWPCEQAEIREFHRRIENSLPKNRTGCNENVANLGVIYMYEHPNNRKYGKNNFKSNWPNSTYPRG